MNVWDALTGELVGSFEGHKGAVNTFDVSPDSEWLVTGSGDGFLRIFRALTGELVLEHKVGAIVRSVEFARTPASSRLSLVMANDKWPSGEKVAAAVTIFSFDTKALTLTSDVHIVEDLPMKAMCVKFGPLDRTVVTVHEEGTLFVWDSTTGTKIKEIQAHSRACTRLQFSVDRKLCITASADMSAKLWEAVDWELVREYKSDRPLNDASISPIYRGPQGEGTTAVGATMKREHVLLAGGQEARDVTTTSLHEGKFETLLFHMVLEHELGKVKGHFGPLHTVAWASNGKGFATGSEDGFVRVHWMDGEYFGKKWE